MILARSMENRTFKFCRTVFLIMVAAPTMSVQAQLADLRLVAMESPGTSDTLATLPASTPRFLSDASFVVEFWAQTSHSNGLSSVSADLAFPSSLASVSGVVHSGTFGVLTSGTINNSTGTIDNLSGSHLGSCADAVGVSPNWARVATLSIAAHASGVFSVQSGPTGSPIYGTAICGVGNIAEAQIAFGSVAVDLVECLSNADCDDGQYCNGAESCNLTTFTCQPGTPPSCDDGYACTVDSCDPQGSGGAGACVNTANHAFCNDGQFCNGSETCQPGHPEANPSGCVAGAAPVCADSVACTVDACDPLANGGLGACTYTPNHAMCDNMQFCDGAESCDGIQGCLAGIPPCGDPCEHCVEASDSCELCIFDLDESGVMGTGDFSFFAPCFGACYALGHPCGESNFDEDAGGCVGTSDFAAFVGCFGLACGQCAGCAGPAGGAPMNAASLPMELDPQVRVRVIARSVQGGSESAKSPPQPETTFAVGKQIYLEIWVVLENVAVADGRGLASAYVDMQLDPRRLRLLSIVPSEAFALLAGGSPDPVNGTLKAVGGCADLDSQGMGADGTWVKVATVITRAEHPGETNIVVGPSDELHGIARVGAFRNIDSFRLQFDGAALQIQKKVWNGRIER